MLRSQSALGRLLVRGKGACSHPIGFVHFREPSFRPRLSGRVGNGRKVSCPPPIRPAESGFFISPNLSSGPRPGGGGAKEGRLPPPPQFPPAKPPPPRPWKTCGRNQSAGSGRCASRIPTRAPASSAPTHKPRRTRCY